MDNERFERANQTFAHAVQLDPMERTSYLDEACAGDPELRNEVELMLISEMDTLGDLPGAQEDLRSDQIGAYRLLGKLGYGGMGVVYLARPLEGNSNRQVAIKIVKRGMDTDEILRRFQREQRILTALNHPNIAQMIHAGSTEDGLPYFIMEYVPGVPIDKYCDALKLNITERLKLFRIICAAVEYAHQQRIVHRDLKPGNIFITDQGVPKLLDFGIAKLLPGVETTAAFELTATGRRMMTPDYASPEQMHGGKITPRSDVYSLGVVLYELLTGHRPHQVHGFQSPEVIQQMIEKDAVRPSAIISQKVGIKDLTPESVSSRREGSPKKLRRRLKGDLDNIVSLALRKEPEARYPSVESFSEDIRRHLEEVSVTARKAMLRYRIRGTLQKRRTAIVACVLLIVLASVLSVFYRNKMETRGNKGLPATIPSVAVLPFLDVSKDKEHEYFADGLAEEIINILSQNSQLRVVARASAFAFKGKQENLREIGRKLSVNHILQGSVRKDDTHVRITVQLISVKDGIHLWSQTYDRKIGDVFEVQSDIATQIANALQVRLSPLEMRWIEKKPTVSITAYDYYLKGREYYLRRRKDDNENAIQLFQKALEVDPNFALAYAGLGDAYHKRSYMFGFPETWIDESIKVCQKAIAIDPDLSEAYVVLAKGYRSKRQRTKALEAVTKSLELNPNSTSAAGMFSIFLADSGELVEGLKWAKKAVSLDPVLSFNYYLVADVYFQLDDMKTSEAWLNKSLELQPDSSFALIGLGYLNLMQGRSKEAREFVQRILSNDSNLGNVAFAAEVELFLKNYEKAEEYYRKSNLPVSVEWSNSWTRYGFTLMKLGRAEEAKKIFERNKELEQNLMEPGYENLYDLATISAIEGSTAEAYDGLQKAIDAGYLSYRVMMGDPLLENLQGDVRFQEMMKNLKDRVAEMRRLAASAS